MMHSVKCIGGLISPCGILYFEVRDYLLIMTLMKGSESMSLNIRAASVGMLIKSNMEQMKMVGYYSLILISYMTARGSDKMR